MPGFLAFGKWLAGLTAVIIGATACAWSIPVTGSGNSTSPAPVSSPAPSAPPITNNFGTTLFNEKVIDIQIKPGEQYPIVVRNIWSAPAGVVPSCASGIFIFTWIVQEPYPQGGNDLEFRRVVPQGGGRTETLAQGSTGSASAGYCDELSVINHSLQAETVEIRYAFGNYPGQ